MLSRIILFFSVIVIFGCACQQKEDENRPKDAYILNENFDSNTLGWVEEYTAAHRTELSNGYLYINSIDTAARQTSNGPMDRSFLLHFPDTYEIRTSITLTKHRKAAYFGIILVSASVEYKFAVSDSGTASLKEWDDNRKTELRLFQHALSPEDTSMKSLNFRISAHYRNFEFYINEELMGEGIFNSKNWQDIRLFNTPGSTIAVNYLRIRKMDD